MLVKRFECQFAFERERAEAGVLLPSDKSRRQITELPFNASEQDNRARRKLKRMGCSHPF